MLKASAWAALKRGLLESDMSFFIKSNIRCSSKALCSGVKVIPR